MLLKLEFNFRLTIESLLQDDLERNTSTIERKWDFDEFLNSFHVSLQRYKHLKKKNATLDA